MSDKIPLKSEGGQQKNFVSGDTIPIKHGGTGVTRFPSKGYVLSDHGNDLTTVKCEFTKTVDPTSTDDSTDGYVIGSRWINIKTRREWLCVDHKYRDAVWISCCSEDEIEDTFRYHISLVDFKYDYQEFFWDRRACEDFKDVITIIYRYNGTPPSFGDVVGELEIFYNQYSQPSTVRMTYDDSSVKILSFAYDEDGYFKEVVKLEA